MENIISILIFIGAGLWIALLLSALVGKTLALIFRRKKSNKKWQAHSEEAEAIVLHTEQVQDTNKQSKLKIQLQVRPARGRNFVVEIKEALMKDEMISLRTGNIVRVKYNPSNTRELFLIKTAS